MGTTKHAKVSTIKLHVNTMEELKKFRIFARETYEDIIRRLIAVYNFAQPELKEEVLEECRRRVLEVEKGDYLTTEELLEDLEKHWAKQETKDSMVRKGKKGNQKDS